ncbi:FAD-dependent oxidoreductase, partial [Bordetella pertussis]|uniref:FAD-dependent oxidoreductase n=1 Tax=Bordetella pertussis TaxID=520 RepID=UPI0021CBFBB0
MKTYDVVVVGAGMLGIAHAWAAARRGLSVAVVERSPAGRRVPRRTVVGPRASCEDSIGCMHGSS